MSTRLQEVSIYHCQSGEDLETEHSARMGSLLLCLQGGAREGEPTP